MLSDHPTPTIKRWIYGGPCGPPLSVFGQPLPGRRLAGSDGLVAARPSILHAAVVLVFMLALLLLVIYLMKRR
jgi:hypothetical protein